MRPAWLPDCLPAHHSSSTQKFDYNISCANIVRRWWVCVCRVHVRWWYWIGPGIAKRIHGIRHVLWYFQNTLRMNTYSAYTRILCVRVWSTGLYTIARYQTMYMTAFFLRVGVPGWVNTTQFSPQIIWKFRSTLTSSETTNTYSLSYHRNDVRNGRTWWEKLDLVGWFSTRAR